MPKQEQIDEQAQREAIQEGLDEMAGIAGRDITKEGKRPYWRALKSFRPEIIRAAYERAIAEAAGWVWPGTWRAHALALSQRAAQVAANPDYKPPTPEQAEEMRRDAAEMRRRWEEKNTDN